MQRHHGYGTFFTSTNHKPQNSPLKTALLKTIEDYLAHFPLWKKRPYQDGRDTAQLMISKINTWSEFELPERMVACLEKPRGEGLLGTSTDLRQALTNTMCRHFGVNHAMIMSCVPSSIKDGVAASIYADTTLLVQDAYIKASYKCLKHQISTNRELDSNMKFSRELESFTPASRKGS
jgi:hypothetical protein